MNTYEQKYKSALEWMRSIYLTMQGVDKEDAEHYFPELKESEDERIRKEIIQSIQDNMCVIHKDKCLAWLEKQDIKLQEYIDEERNKKDFYCEGKEMSWNEIPLDVRKHDYPYYFKDGLDCFPFNAEKQGEQKPAEWSEEDEKMLNEFIESLRYCNGNGYNKQIDWLKCLKDRVQPQPKQNPIKQDTEAHDLWMYIREWNDKFGRLPKDEDELAACIDYVMKRQKAAWSEKHIADVFEKVGLAKIVREQGNDQLTNAVQSAMIELSKTAGGFVWKKI